MIIKWHGIPIGCRSAARTRRAPLRPLAAAVSLARHVPFLSQSLIERPTGLYYSPKVAAIVIGAFVYIFTARILHRQWR